MAKRKRRGLGAPDGEHVVAAEKAIKRVYQKMGGSCDRMAILEVGAEYGRALAHVEAISDKITRRDLSKTLDGFREAIEGHASRCSR